MQRSDHLFLLQILISVVNFLARYITYNLAKYGNHGRFTWEEFKMHFLDNSQVLNWQYFSKRNYRWPFWVGNTKKIHIFEEWKCIFALILLKKTRRRGGFLKPTKNPLKRSKLVASLQYCIAAKKFFVSFIETTIFYNFEEIGLAIGQTQKLNQNVRNSAKICKDFFVESIFDYETFHQMRIMQFY